jgi:cytochrome c
MSLAFALWLALVTPATAQDALPPTPEFDQTERSEEIEAGKLLYGIYCRNCHGAEGRGDGPEAKSFEARLPDLTRLSRKNDGQFPTARVLMMIDGRQRVPGHVKGRMPIWGLSLQEADSDTNQEEAVRRKIESLLAYLKSIQKL